MSRLGEERGSVLIAATAIVAIMFMIGVSTLALVDRQQHESGMQRLRESSLNLGEGVLYSQAFVLARNWPSTGAGLAAAFPASCTSGSVTTPKCPDRNSLAAANSQDTARANFANVDFQADTTWVTKVRDNGGALAASYAPQTSDLTQAGCALTPCTLDANGDRRLWVHVRSVVRGRPRSIVALLQLELFREAFPRAAITAGRLDITNNGNHGGQAIIDNAGSQISVRCNPGSSSCVDYKAGQISSPSFAQLSGSSPPALGASQLARLKARAMRDGRYFATCPPNDANLAGAVVWVEDCTSSYATALASVPCGAPLSGQCINTLAAPGVLIWHKGAVKFTGNQTFVGIVYMVNNSDVDAGLGPGAGPVLEIGGGFSINGGISIDGHGGLDVGSNASPNFKYNPNAFTFESYGTAGLVQNTWRELPAG